MEKGKSTTFEHHQHCNFEDGEIKLKGKWHDGKTYIETYRPDGSLKHIREYDRIITDFKAISKGKKGTFVYRENGKTFKDTFTFKHYFKNGHLACEGARKSGEYYGSYKSYHGSGDLNYHRIYKNNFEWDEVWKDRIIAKQRVWKNKSVYQSLWSDGTTRQITRYDRKMSTFQSTFNFETCSSEYYSKGGQLLEQNSFNEGNHPWIHKEYYDNGKLKLKWKVVGSFLHGKYECFFENGQIKASGKYRHGKSSGIHKKWDSKGNLLFCGRFFDGILFGKDSDGKPLEGFIETYYEDETPQFKGEFINGKLDGIVQIWTRSPFDIFSLSDTRARKTSARYVYKDGKRHIWKMSQTEFDEWSETLWLDYIERWEGYPSHDKYHTQLLLKYFLSHGRSEGQPSAFPPATPNVWGDCETSWLDQKWNIEFLYTYHKDCTEVLIYWQLPLLEQYVGKISKSDFRNPCSDTQSKVWRYFNRYMESYQVLDTDKLTKQLFWRYPENDLEHITKTKKRLNNHLFLTLFIPKDIKFDEMNYEDFDTQDLREFFLYYDI